MVLVVLAFKVGFMSGKVFGSLNFMTVVFGTTIFDILIFLLFRDAQNAWRFVVVTKLS